MAGRGGFFRGGAPSLRPESAIKRADELLSVGQKQNALQTLHDTITNKRQQRNWTKALEQVRQGGRRSWAAASPSPSLACHALPASPTPAPPPVAGHVQVH